ncbi:MAG: PAS domain S-box protein [Bacteroidota bacterium]
MKNRRNLQMEQTRNQSHVELSHKNEINQVFLTIPGDEMYAEVLEILLEVMESKHGLFGYIDEQGNLVIPSMTREIWENCQVPEKAILFPRTSWGGIWGRALTEKKSLFTNDPLNVPEGHLPINNVLVVPVMYMENVIGIVQVANSEPGYDKNSQDLLEKLVNHIAPILDARLQRDVKENERTRVAEALRLQSEIATNLSEGIYLIRMSDGIIVYTNPKFEEMFGYASGEMVGKHVSIVNSPDAKDPEETAKEIMEVLIKTGEWHGEVKNVKKDGISFWCYANVSIFDHHEYGKVLVSVHTDISERKKAEEALRDAHQELELKVEDGQRR